ncbi:hypothetical protein GWI33_017954 [Rhynchophorus ferrugineus]|uniref:Uncharacterized protein n=1 Tax=Rhynchophorus ferrugineus TaxID=354439 RepID=A0A834HUT4_RHYFE|nr:hypothetical protein GWI33_017954 [Rhynchophorus ferrugineus]
MVAALHAIRDNRSEHWYQGTSGVRGVHCHKLVGYGSRKRCNRKGGEPSKDDRDISASELSLAKPPLTDGPQMSEIPTLPSDHVIGERA